MTYGFCFYCFYFLENYESKNHLLEKPGQKGTQILPWALHGELQLKGWFSIKHFKLSKPEPSAINPQGISPKSQSWKGKVVCGCIGTLFPRPTKLTRNPYPILCGSQSTFSSNTSRHAIPTSQRRKLRSLDLQCPTRGHTGRKWHGHRENVTSLENASCFPDSEIPEIPGWAVCSRDTCTSRRHPGLFHVQFFSGQDMISHLPCGMYILAWLPASIRSRNLF